MQHVDIPLMLPWTSCSTNSRCAGDSKRFGACGLSLIQCHKLGKISSGPTYNKLSFSFPVISDVYYMHLVLSYSVDFKTPQELWNPLIKAVPGTFRGSAGHSKRTCLKDRANFHKFRAWQIVLIFNTANTRYFFFRRHSHGFPPERRDDLQPWRYHLDGPHPGCVHGGLRYAPLGVLSGGRATESRGHLVDLWWRRT